MMRLLTLLVLVMTALGLPSRAQAACSAPLIGVSASIEAIIPYSGTVSVRDRRGTDRIASVGDCLQPDELLTVPDQVERVTIFDGFRRVDLTRGGAWKSPGRYQHWSAQSADFFEKLIAQLPKDLRTQVSGSTALRAARPGMEPVLPDAQDVLQTIAPDLSGGRLATAWRGGTGQWTCLVDGRARLNHGSDTFARECHVDIEGTPTRLTARDGGGGSLAWRLQRVPAAAVPRPPWLPGGIAVPEGDLTAWGLWLLRDPAAGPQWRLQGYSMLAAGRETSWAAGLAGGHVREGSWDAFRERGTQAPRRRIALVIGNGDYVAAPKLSGPLVDAPEVSRTLADFSFVWTLTNQTREEMLRIIAAFAAQARSADVAVIYYAGHGMEYAGRNYLLPVDARLEVASAIPAIGIDLEAVLDAAAGARWSKFVFIDACRDETLAQRLDRRSGAPVHAGLARPSTRPDMAVVFSAQEGAVAEDGGTAGSPFARAFVRLVRRPGVPAETLMRDVRNAVAMETRGRQMPVVYSALSEEYYFRRPLPIPLSGPVPPPSVPPIGDVDDPATWRALALNSAFCVGPRAHVGLYYSPHTDTVTVALLGSGADGQLGVGCSSRGPITGRYDLATIPMTGVPHRQFNVTLTFMTRAETGTCRTLGPRQDGYRRTDVTLNVHRSYATSTFITLAWPAALETPTVDGKTRPEVLTGLDSIREFAGSNAAMRYAVSVENAGFFAECADGARSMPRFTIYATPEALAH